MSGPDSTSRKCGFPKRDGDLCKRAAGERTEHHGWGYCWLHRGNTPTGIKHAVRQRWQEMRMTFYHLEGLPDVPAEQVLLEELRRSRGIVLWLQLAIEQWRTCPESADEEWQRLNDPGASSGLEPLGMSTSTGLPLQGAVVLFDKGGAVTQTEMAAWLDRYERERTWAAKVAKMVIDAGVAERVVRVLEQEIDLMVGALRASFTDMGLELTPERVEIVGRHLRAIGGQQQSA